MGIEADFSQTRQLARDLDNAGPRAEREIRRVIRVGANVIKKGMRRDFSGHAHAPHIPNAISYDPVQTVGEIEYEIGVDKTGPQGGLGNILAYGTSNNAPVVDHTAALHREAPIVEQKIADAGENAPLGARR